MNRIEVAKMQASQFYVEPQRCRRSSNINISLWMHIFVFIFFRRFVWVWNYVMPLSELCHNKFC